MVNFLIDFLKKILEKLDKNGDTQIPDISDKMAKALKEWQEMYEDNAQWIDRPNGIYSLGLSKMICKALSRYVLSELEISSENEDMQAFIDVLVDKLRSQFERGLALGSMVVKPYISDDDVYLSFFFPGEFYPLKFDNVGRITDIVFIDKYTSGTIIYSRVEQHTLINNVLTITNKAYKTSKNGNDTDLGQEIPLTSVERWQEIQPETKIANIDKPLFGFFKTPIANNIDTSSPLGVSTFAAAKELIERADRQFSRLDWEYEGGQIAIDVDQFAIREQQGYYGKVLEMDSTKNRLYRKIDLNDNNTYEAFTPSLRDSSYIQGLERYLRAVEDSCGLARGELSDVSADARTATEIKILKQRQYVTVSENQDMLEAAIRDCIDAVIALSQLYNVGNYVDKSEIAIEWKDSILTDTETELQQRISLVDKGILSDIELRMWYTGEDEQTAAEKITEIKENKQANMMNDIYSSLERQ